MFDINMQFNDIAISSIEKEDIKAIQQWYNDEKDYFDKNENYLEMDELYERFLEYYVSESEFFLKISKHGKLIGIFKGRVEFKNTNKVWIASFIVQHQHKTKEVQDLILKEILNYFLNNYGINEFSTMVTYANKDMLELWKNNGFMLTRISPNFYKHNDKKDNIMILERE
ncbi:MAG: GNAT family N-acetyltransferase [Bacillota bacterium]|nr:GNAT family N-acetyltransferase [Bacillota bacterium]